MRIAKPLLLVLTPIGVAWGLVEAARFHWWLALLMGVLVGVISLFMWMTVRRIRADRESS
jgi:cbb3-type cytochrome oxidase subunit 3